MKPWREVAIPNGDVLESKFLQSEFAADITAVSAGKAPKEYQDAAAFFQRTFITEGMRHLLIQVGQRLNSKGGEPVIQLQTGFGGGKTHTMLAVYHLATRKCELSELHGISEVLAQGGLMGVPNANVAVIDGNAHAAGQPWKYGNHVIRTIWGELAWQLGGESAFSLIAESDAAGTSPGKKVLQTLLETYAPCVVLIDELVAYFRQFPEGKTLSGGSFDSNLSFIQALTEACKLVPNAIILASLPESATEVGQRGVSVLRSLESTYGRVQAVWKPVATEEAFEIVRRRLFQPITDDKSRTLACKAFAEMYIAEGSKVPPETQEARYLEQLLQAYPIHPEVFDRLFKDWTTIEGFQRTRGVLKLMAKVIYRLWNDENKDVMIMPGSLPLYDGNSRNELTCYLPGGWDAVLERDIDGDRAETTELESKEPRFGSVNAARRVARTIFLGSAPSSALNKAGSRGIDRPRIVLGCLQPNQTSSTFSDALNRLADLLHHLNSSGDKSQEGTRFWFDIRPTLRREMESRKQRFSPIEVRTKMAQLISKVASSSNLFEGIHPFTAHNDVPDDGKLRLVILEPEKWHSREETRLSFDAVNEYLRHNGSKQRHRGNRLIFLAADNDALTRLRDCISVWLAWQSIVEDEAEARLVLDTLQVQQAKRELQVALEVLPRVVKECYKWLLCPMQNSPEEPKITIESFQLNTSSPSVSGEIERVCRENELVISTWSPSHLRTMLTNFYWKEGIPAVLAMSFWEDSSRYLYLPRLKDKEVLEQAIVKGCGSTSYFGTAEGQHNGRFDGFKLGDSNVRLDDNLLLIEPEYAGKYAKELAEKSTQDHELVAPESKETKGGTGTGASSLGINKEGAKGQSQSAKGTAKIAAKSYHSSVHVNPSTAKMRLMQLAEEIISVLSSDPQADVKVTVEINAEFPAGVSDEIKRAVTENALHLNVDGSWEH